MRPFEDGKSRLAEAMAPEDRAALNRRLFGHVLGVAVDVFGGARTVVVSASDEVLRQASARGANGVREAGSGQNAALQQGSRSAADGGARAVVTVSCDLPCLAPEDLAALADDRDAPRSVRVAADRGGCGTNALFVRPVGLIAYRYGPESCAAHVAQARAAGARLTVVHKPGLAFDIDTPADLSLWRAGAPQPMWSAH
jgi:2-phospho-L-lactate guanylyltransferase